VTPVHDWRRATAGADAEDDGHVTSSISGPRGRTVQGVVPGLRQDLSDYEPRVVLVAVRSTSGTQTMTLPEKMEPRSSRCSTARKQLVSP